MKPTIRELLGQIAAHEGFLKDAGAEVPRAPRTLELAMSDFDAAKKRLEEMDRANLFLNHGRAKHADACWRCDEPWPCLTMRVVIDADHELAQWHDKWIAALDTCASLVGKEHAEVERLRSLLEANIPPRTYGSLQEEVDFLRRDVASLQANKHNLITRLAAERERSERLEKALESIESEMRGKSYMRETAREALSAAASDPTPSEEKP